MNSSLFDLQCVAEDPTETDEYALLCKLVSKSAVYDEVAQEAIKPCRSPKPWDNEPSLEDILNGNF